MNEDDIERLVDHVLGRGDGPLDPELHDAAEELQSALDALEKADPAEVAAAAPPPDLLARIQAATGPAPARTRRRHSPSWMGRWTPAVAAAVLVIVIGVAALVQRGGDDFVPFELATQGGQPVTAEFRVVELEEGTRFDVRTTGLDPLEYHVWVLAKVDGERHWLGRFVGDISGSDSFETEFDLTEIERLWVTDPADELVLAHDLAGGAPSYGGREPQPGSES